MLADPVKVTFLETFPTVTFTTLVPDGTDAFNPMLRVPALLTLKYVLITELEFVQLPSFVEVITSLAPEGFTVKNEFPATGTLNVEM